MAGKSGQRPKSEALKATSMLKKLAGRKGSERSETPVKDLLSLLGSLDHNSFSDPDIRFQLGQLLLDLEVLTERSGEVDPKAAKLLADFKAFHLLFLRKAGELAFERGSVAELAEWLSVMTGELRQRAESWFI